MSFFLKERSPEEQAQHDAVVFQGTPTFGERMRAQATETRIRKDLNNQRQKVDRDLAEEMRAQIPPQYIVPATPFKDRPAASQRHDDLFASVARAKAANPKFGNLPTSIKEFDAEVDRRRLAELQEAQDVLSRSDGWVAEIIGDIGAELSTPESLALALGGGIVGSGRLGATILAEGVLAGADEARTLPDQFRVADELDQPEPEPFKQVGIAAATGAGIAGVLGGSAKALSYGWQRANSTGQRRPADARPLRWNQDVVNAEAALTEGKTPEPQKVEFPADDPLNTILPAGQREQAPLVRRILDFTGDLEAPKGYDQIYSGIGRADYPPKPLTQMSIKEVLNWQDSIDARYQSEASGRYQFMEDTLRALYPKLGLTGNEMFDSAMQDRLAVALMREKGLDDFLAGKLSARAFGQNLSKVWAGLPQLTGAGRGSSFYAGLAGNKSLSSAARFEAILAPDGTYTPRPRGEGTPYTGGTSRGYTTNGTVTAGQDFRIDVEYQVVDLATLTRASGDLQPRDRSRSSSDEQVAEIAAGLDPARLLPAPEADRGAPIVGPDSIIESGNGRVLAVQRAYERHPDRAERYRTEIEAAGFEVPEGVEQPILVGRRTSELTDGERQQFVRQANMSTTARMSATERAAVDARALDAETVAMFDPEQPLNSRANAPFAKRVLGSMPQAERNALVSPEGNLNAEGVTRLRQAMFARAFDAPDILARFAEADAGQLRSLMDALETAAPAWGGMRSAIAEGRLRAELDVTPFFLDAMRLIADARQIATRENKASADMVEELLSEVDLLEGAVAPLTAALVRKMYAGGRAQPADKISALMARYAAEARKVGSTEAALFDDVVSPLDILQRIDPETFADIDDIGAARLPDTDPPAHLAAPSDALPQGAMSAGADADLAQQAADEIVEALQDVQDARATLDSLRMAQPFDDLDQLYDLAPDAQAFIAESGADVARALDLEFIEKGFKQKDTAAEKIVRKEYTSVRQLTDVARATIVATNAKKADQVVALLAQKADLIDEGWAATPTGYIDRKVIIRTPNGVVAEMIIAMPEMATGKGVGGGHKLYTKYRATTDKAEADSLMAQMKALYQDALERSDPSFVKELGTSNAPKVRSNIALNAVSSGTTRAVPATSLPSTATQSLPGSSSASALPSAAENRTAGRPSQSQSVDDVMGDTSNTNISTDPREINAAADEAAEIRAAVADLSLGDDIEIPLEDGSTFSTRQILDDLEQDEVLTTIIDACNVKGAA